jgi:hypothetical protein
VTYHIATTYPHVGGLLGEEVGERLEGGPAAGEGFPKRQNGFCRSHTGETLRT